MHTESNAPPTPVDHVLVDFENVQNIDPSILDGKTVHFMLLLGPRQKKLDVTLIEKLLQDAASVELVRLTSTGKNAVDFALAYYLGKATAADPSGHFHIISKDTGYDPLIEHLGRRHVCIRRCDAFPAQTLSAPARQRAPAPTAAPPVAQARPKPKPQTYTPDELEKQAVEHLRQQNTKRPRTKTKLASYLVTHFGKRITPPEALSLVERLNQTGHITFGAQGKVTYNL